MPESLVARIKEGTQGKSKLELALVTTTALLLGGGFLYIGVSLP